MSGKSVTLSLIGALIALVVGSFIWLIASGDSTAEEPVTKLRTGYEVSA